MELLVILALLSLCQSIFGMGLLVFGTPILLLLDYNFEQALWILLPASITISSLQMLEIKSLDRAFRNSFLTWSLPALVIALSGYLIWRPSYKFEWFLGALMLIFSIVRVLPPRAEIWISNIVSRFSIISMLLMGFVHGISNMGGSVLSIITASNFTSKTQIRDAIVFCYWFFGFFQIVLLVIFSMQEMNLYYLSFSPLAAAIYLTIGKRSYNIVEQKTFRQLFTLFILICSILLLLK